MVSRIPLQAMTSALATAFISDSAVDVDTALVSTAPVLDNNLDDLI